MATAAYYRMKAQECFERATKSRSANAATLWRQRGREYSELAVDAESRNGADPPRNVPAKEEDPT
jgi:hypothetical protein